MNIESAKYMTNLVGKIDSVNLVIDGVKMSVPLDEENRHYQAFQKWLAEGNTPEPADEPSAA